MRMRFPLILFIKTQTGVGGYTLLPNDSLAAPVNRFNCSEKGSGYLFIGAFLKTLFECHILGYLQSYNRINHFIFSFWVNKVFIKTKSDFISSYINIIIIKCYFLRKTNFDNLSPAAGGKIFENLSIVLRKVSGSFLTFIARSVNSRHTKQPVRSPIAAKISQVIWAQSEFMLTF